MTPNFIILQEDEARPPARVLAQISELGAILFTRPLDDWDARLAGRQHIFWCWAECPSSGDVIGFKVGYEDRPGRFYSWLGGVKPAREGEGVASALMRAQHDWAKSQGYKRVRTHTSNAYRRMLSLNILHGFDVIGTVHPRSGGMRIVMEREL